MDFELTAEQESLKGAVRELFRRSYDFDRVKRSLESERGWRSDVWEALRDTGVLGLAIAEEYDGAGAGPVEVAVVMGEIGRVHSPEPVLAAAFVPADVISRAGDERQRMTYLGAIAAGESLGAFAHEESQDRWPHREVAATARPSGDGYVVSGTKTLVRHGDCADFVIVSARVDGELGLFVVQGGAEGVTREPYRSHDGRRGAHVTLVEAIAERLEAGDVADTLRHAEVLEQVSLCAEAVGAMDEALRITIEYLTTRRQFGVPLSSFQALKHRVADLFVLVELARSLTSYAVSVLEDGAADLNVASRAKLQVCRAARTVGHEVIHLHGGIGVTDEHPIGHYASRLLAIEQTLGGAAEHLGALAAVVHQHDAITVG
jgi:alkylation response protein AidB-like acyl-CoA dehydrogenase